MISLNKRIPSKIPQKQKKYNPERKSKLYLDSIKKNSYKIAKIANIDSICNSLEDMSNKVDAVILARDDIENHLEMAKIFLKKNTNFY